MYIVVDKFGWAGSFLIAIMLFIFAYATREQKERMIETYVLGNSPQRVAPLVILSLTFLLVLFAQAKWYNRTKKRLEDRIVESEKEKLELRNKIKGQPRIKRR